MASNPTPDNDDIALALAEELADGCHALEVTLGIKQNTEAVMRAAIAAALAARVNHSAKLQLLRDRMAELQTADEAAIATLTNCQLRFFKLFGKTYSGQWQTAGWPGGKIIVPSKQDQRYTLLTVLAIYFTNTPASESTEMGATAALCTAAAAAFSTARQAVNSAETAEGTAMAARKATMKTLRKRIRSLIVEIGTLIAEDDMQYETFGLNVPANPSAPLGITALTLTAAGGGKIHAAWPYATRMTGTRLLTKRQGIDVVFQNAGTADGLEKTLEGFTAGQVVDVQAIPYNDGGDGPGSPVKTVTVA